ncbi:hypothetical protein [Phycisphaera mikurensis]|uniref:Uncharacterized protein n=1 Tax=Phycisphaera mikurensis (strain NBRC 102666 / KCTC 22515 / FYK2301M01) TaxID=1142394 RepID=I0IEZ3_PHYMF|nr:hypothetical protein [Phycisphaera mikurensis]MBB6441625.1 hypothetical protein [Phycisphaera mikurensis]BAM03831.1 hypothetical protein PSMK_16720 [Phycisphaera mikurensis NBRC 102666]
MPSRLPTLLLVPLLAGGCYPVRNPGPADPRASTALPGTLPDPVRDPADDPDTVSPVEPQDAPGDAGAIDPGSLGVAPARPVRIGPTPQELSARRAARDTPSNAAVLDRWPAKQRAELDARRAAQESGRLRPAAR